MNHVSHENTLLVIVALVDWKVCLSNDNETPFKIEELVQLLELIVVDVSHIICLWVGEIVNPWMRCGSVGDRLHLLLPVLYHAECDSSASTCT